MSWTRMADLRSQVQKLWDDGDLLRAKLGGAGLFPRRLRLQGPTSAELAGRFDDVRAWMAELRGNTDVGHVPHLRIVMREFRHRILGSNAVPDEVWLDTLDDALALISRQRDAKRFDALVLSTRAHDAPLGQLLVSWLAKRPLNALALVEVWPRLLAVVSWLHAHPRPGIYLRQVDISGVDSKFIEMHRRVLSELLDLVMPAESIDGGASGVGQFCQRYGFLDKPLRIRFRVLDTGIALLPDQVLALEEGQDITLTQRAFQRLVLSLDRVFFTENEVNFLVFPAVPRSLVIFGSGYGFDVLDGVEWLHRCDVHYWGDIDTHGFAILEQLRSYLPHAKSLLMDRATLMAHAAHWGQEPQPLNRNLPRLSVAETELFDDLRYDRIQKSLRLEQERVGFAWLKNTLEALVNDR